MRPATEVYLFGSLQKKLPDSYDPPILLELESSSALAEVLEILRISPDLVQLSMVNHKAVPKEAVIHPGDRLSLFPTDYPVFVDWKDFRF
jgi:hypothetical protein